jgi:hypothetical protein
MVDEKADFMPPTLKTLRHGYQLPLRPAGTKRINEAKNPHTTQLQLWWCLVASSPHGFQNVLNYGVLRPNVAVMPGQTPVPMTWAGVNGLRHVAITDLPNHRMALRRKQEIEGHALTPNSIRNLKRDSHTALIQLCRVINELAAARGPEIVWPICPLEPKCAVPHNREPGVKSVRGEEFLEIDIVTLPGQLAPQREIS